ncbi:hemin uptake protein HemP [Cribrihabitans neustonicus]|uniref:hemin uptake protein HemP n=1 Tax=Cribrihabitans neustonicus TaxID=1429085 RepID=UPI003B595334
MNQISPAPSAAAAAPAAAEVYPTYHAEELTRGGVQARILLNGQIYSLRITRAGKLILTK